MVVSGMLCPPFDPAMIPEDIPLEEAEKKIQGVLNGSNEWNPKISALFVDVRRGINGHQSGIRSRSQAGYETVEVGQHDRLSQIFKRVNNNVQVFSSADRLATHSGHLVFRLTPKGHRDGLPNEVYEILGCLRTLRDTGDTSQPELVRFYEWIVEEYKLALNVVGV